MNTDSDHVEGLFQVSLPFDILATILETTALLYRQFARQELLTLSSSVHSM